MPEGDSIWKVAQKLAPALIGKKLERVTTQGLERNIAGRTVTSVAPHGKHLTITLDDGAYIRCHLGMNGRVRTYDLPDGKAALSRLSPGRVSLALHTDAGVYLWLTTPTVEISHRRAPNRGQAVATLGPDVLADDFDPTLAAARAAASDTSRSIADGLLDQRISAGIGNVYKSEILFLRGVDPRTPIRDLSAKTLVELFTTARELMLDNLGPGPRTTRERLAGDRPGDERYFVYGRTGKPCRRCGALVEAYQLGAPTIRWTWSCPTCQSRPESRHEPGGSDSGVNR